MAPTDPFAAFRQAISPDDVFDPGRDQHTGIVLGMAIASRQMHDAETGQPSEIFLIRPGDDVEITLPSAGPNPTPISENCTVVDLYESRMHEYDSMFAFLPLSRLQALRGMIDPLTGQTSISAIHIKLRPGADLDQARDRLIAHFPPDRFGYVIQTWQDTQRPLLSAVELEVTILNILLFLIIAVAGFGILATFFMIVVEKTRDIGILKSLGATSRGVASIFLGYGFSLGSVGTGVGIGLGLLIVAHINDIADALQRWTGREVFDPEIYYFNEIPAAVDVWTVACVAGGAILIAVLASVLPSIRAARLHPVEALRYE
jgi:lipoprotein-releasing system permease protein